MFTHAGWALVGDTWRAVAERASVEAAYKQLLCWIRRQERPPPASAVLPCGVHPGGRPAHAEGQGGPGAVKADQGSA